MAEDVKMEGLKVQLKKEARKVKLNFEELKSGGYIKQTQQDLFTVRLRGPGGMLEAEKLIKAGELAKKYGSGTVHISFRQSVEIPYVHYKDFEALTQELKEVNWSVASCGLRIRVPTACAGCTYNPNGLLDTVGICKEVDKRYFGTPTGHHKFKISFAGCPIDCPRTREMDLGFQAMVEPVLLEDICNGCTLCVAACDEKALEMKNELPFRFDDKCNSCGDCIKVCPIDAMLPQRKGWLVRVGGKHGKHPYYAYEVAQFVTDEQVFLIIEKSLEWTTRNCVGRERIGVAIERLSLKKYIDEVLKPLGIETIETDKERKKYYSRGNMYVDG